MKDADFYFNGISGIDGAYLSAPKTLDEVRAAVFSMPADRGAGRQAIAAYDPNKKLGPARFVDPRRLSSSGWAIILAQADPRRQQIEKKLKPLLDHRRQLAGAAYRRYVIAEGVTAVQFLTDNNADATGPANPWTFDENDDPLESVPYYLLIVGDPLLIPFDFQFELDVQYAVGRLHFDDLDAYRGYAESVVAAEKELDPLPARAAFFGPSFDRHTELSATWLVDRLCARVKQTFERERKLREQHDPNNPLPAWDFASYSSPAPGRDLLTSLLGGDQRAPFVLAASHGLGLPEGHKSQMALQGALMCEKPFSVGGKLSPNTYLSGNDLEAGNDLRGQIAFLFSCFGAGTPAISEYGNALEGTMVTLADRPFISHLPQSMLGRPGGALAVVGHVDKALGYSFYDHEDGAELATYMSAIGGLLAGDQVGLAMEYFGQRHGELSARIFDEQQRRKARRELQIPGRQLERYWTANADARNFIIVGDPAVRLKVAP